MSEAGPIALAIVAQAECDAWPVLEQVPAAVADLTKALTASGGYESCLPELITGGKKGDVETALGAWLRGLSPTRHAVVYWIGHGTGSYLVTKETPTVQLAADVALTGSALGNMIANSPAEKILVIVDTCYAAGETRWIAQELLQIRSEQTDVPGQIRWVGVLPSASAFQKAREGIFCRALLEVLTGEDVAERTWSDNDEYFSANELGDALLDRLQRELGDEWQRPHYVTHGSKARFLPNPRWHGQQPPITVEDRRRLAVPDALQLAGRGIEVGASGFYFTGRISILSELSRWLGEKQAGLTVLTGPPGSGKSAVLGRLVMLSDPESRAAAEKVGLLADVPAAVIPRDGAVAAAVHTKGMRVADCVRTIGEAAGIELTEASLTPDSLIAALEGRQGALVVDALDEAADPLGIGALLRRLVEEAGARVLIGTRRSPDGRVIREGEHPHAGLRVLFGERALIHDLADEPDTVSDIAAYVTARLGDSRHADKPEAIARAAAGVAERADGAFLYARIVSRTLQDADRLDQPLPSGALAAFAADLKARFGIQRDQVDDLLAALAWAQGAGLSRSVWPTVANALSGRSYRDPEVAWVLDHAGWHILEAGEDGQTVYRLAHQQLADYYLGRTDEPARVQRSISLALAEGITGIGWLDADPYLDRHLADHAARGGTLDRLLLDPGYLAAADPLRLVAALGSTSEQVSRAIGAIYGRITTQLTRADPTERMTLLELVALQENPQFASALEPLLPARWRARWAWWRPTIPFTSVASLPGFATAVATVKPLNGEPLVLVGMGDRVRIWDLVSLAELAGVDDVGGQLVSLAAANLDEGAVLAVGTEDGALRSFLLSDLRLVAEQPAAHRGKVHALVTVSNDSETFLASGAGDGAVALWRLPGLEPVAREGHATEIVKSLSAATLRGASAVVSAGDSFPGEGERSTAAVSLWSIPELRWLGTPDHERVVVDPAIAVPLGDGSVVLTSYLGRASCWDPESGATAASDDPEEYVSLYDALILDSDKQTARVLTCGDGMRMLTVERRGGKLLLDVSPFVETGSGAWAGPVKLGDRQFVVSAENHVRLWDVQDLCAAVDGAPRTSAENFRLQKGHGLLSVAADATAVWAGTHLGDLRRWSQKSGAMLGEPLDLGASVVALATGTDARGQFLCAGAENGAVRIYDGDGEQIRPEIRVADELKDLAVMSAPSGPLMASAGRAVGRPHYEVRLWSMPSGEEFDPTPSNIRRLYERRRELGLPVPDDERGLTMPGWADKRLNAVTFVGSPPSTLVAAGGDLWDIGVWSVEGWDMSTITVSVDSIARVTSLASCDADDDGDFLVAGTRSGSIQAWSMPGAVSVFEGAGVHRGEVHLCCGRWADEYAVFSGAQDGLLKIWSLRSWRCIHTVPIGDWIWAIAAVPNGDVVAATRRGLVALTPGGGPLDTL